jgi:hypothetical protein
LNVTFAAFFVERMQLLDDMMTRGSRLKSLQSSFVRDVVDFALLDVSFLIAVLVREHFSLRWNAWG